MTGPEQVGIDGWLGRTWEVRAVRTGKVSLIMDGGSPILTVAAARQLARSLLDAATEAVRLGGEST